MPGTKKTRRPRSPRPISAHFDAADLVDHLLIIMPLDVTDTELEQLRQVLQDLPGLCPGPRPRSGRNLPTAPKPRA